MLYERTRVAVLNGADGVVFVADSQKQKLEENIKSLRELAVNITKQNKKFQEFPIILQYNKRDVPGALPVPTLDKYLNSLAWQRYEAVATTGAGIFDTLKAISKLVISRLCTGYRLQVTGTGISDVLTPCRLSPVDLPPVR